MNKFINYILPFLLIPLIIFGSLVLFGSKVSMNAVVTAYEPSMEFKMSGTKTLILKTDKVFSHLCVKRSQATGKNPYKMFDLNYIKNTQGLNNAKSSDAQYKGKIQNGKIFGRWEVRSANSKLQSYYEKVIRGLNGAYTSDSSADIIFFVSLRKNTITIEIDNFKPENYSENRICELTGRPKYFVPARGFNVNIKKRAGYMQNEESGEIKMTESGEYKYFSYLPPPKEYR